jgi:hypothetical protein
MQEHLSKKTSLLSAFSLKHGIQNALANVLLIDFANIYLLICNLLITIFMGKPTLSGFLFNVITVYIILYEMKTGELVPRCDKFYASLIAMPFLVLGSFLYSKTRDSVLGVIILLASMWIYNVILLAVV